MICFLSTAQSSRLPLVLWKIEIVTKILPSLFICTVNLSSYSSLRSNVSNKYITAKISDSISKPTGQAVSFLFRHLGANQYGFDQCEETKHWIWGQQVCKLLCASPNQSGSISSLSSLSLSLSLNIMHLPLWSCMMHCIRRIFLVGSDVQKQGKIIPTLSKLLRCLV